MPLKVTDIHVHIQPWEQLLPAVRERMKRGREDLARVERFNADPGAFLAHLDEIGVARAGLINYVAPDVMGFTAEANDFCARYAAHAPERLIPFGSVHPRYVRDAAAEMDRLRGIGIRGIKIHPSHQLLYPNEYRHGRNRALETVYRECSDHRIPVMIHTGTSIFPAARNVYADPIHTDDVGVDFPDLVVILAHGGRPLWMETAFFLLRRFKNFYMDVSGIPPGQLLRYFPRLEEIAEKTLWGTDYPAPMVRDMKANLDAFLALPISDKAKAAILHENSARLF
jgi:predicted TIM-barrel fold metal-dependent hydrolase